MLPTTDTPISSTPVAEFARRLVSFRQMDFEYTLWTMVQLCTDPRRAYRTTLYRSRTKHRWARDDPAFVAVLLYLILLSSLAWCLAFAVRGPLAVLRLFLYVACVDLVGLGALLATAAWWVANNYLHETPACADEWALSAAASRRETVEWRYAFDVHCNAFLPLLLLLCAAPAPWPEPEP